MRPVRDIKGLDNFRLERKGPFCVPKRDPVEPEPVGTIVLMAFRVTGYRPDCDGSLMASVEQIDKNGEITGWEENAIGLRPETGLVVKMDELKAMFST